MVKFDEVDGAGWRSVRRLNIGSLAKMKKVVSNDSKQKHGKC